MSGPESTTAEADDPDVLRRELALRIEALGALHERVRRLEAEREAVMAAKAEIEATQGVLARLRAQLDECEHHRRVAQHELDTERHERRVREWDLDHEVTELRARVHELEVALAEARSDMPSGGLRDAARSVRRRLGRLARRGRSAG